MIAVKKWNFAARVFFGILGLQFTAKSEKLYGVFSDRKEARP